MDKEQTLAKMREYIDRILAYCEGFDEVSFAADTRAVEACAFNLLEIGRLAQTLGNFGIIKDEVGSFDFYEDEPILKLGVLRGDFLHGYAGDALLVWDIINDLPRMRGFL